MWERQDLGPFDANHTDTEKILSGIAVPCRICENVFRRLRLTLRNCALCDKGFCEGEHGTFATRGRATCVQCGLHGTEESLTVDRMPVSVDKAYEIEMTLARKEMAFRQDSNARLLTLQVQVIGGFALAVYWVIEGTLHAPLGRFICAAFTLVTYVIITRTAQNVSYVVALAHFTAGELNQKYRLAAGRQLLVWDWDSYLADLGKKRRRGEDKRDEENGPRDLTLQMISPNVVICGFCFLMATVLFFALPPAFVSTDAETFWLRAADLGNTTLLALGIALNIRAFLAYRKADQ